MKTAIISPHTDDAIFSLGDMIGSGALGEVTIITPFAGIPPMSLDNSVGYTKHTTLRQEHSLACEIIGAEEINGPFLDDVYPDRPLHHLKEWLEEWIADFHQLIVPLGIHHPDHLIIRNAMSRIHEDHWYYEELPYRELYPDLHADLVDELDDMSVISAKGPYPTSLKKTAVEAYRSQIIGGGILKQLYVEERIWI